MKFLTFLALLALATQSAFAGYIAPPYTVSIGGTGSVSFTSNLPLLGNGSGALSQGTVSGNTTVFATTSGTLTLGHCVTIDSNGNLTDSGSPCGSGSGTVSSVALADGSTVPIFTISGSPITGAGTLTETLSTQSANLVFAGPVSGSAAQPTFRSLVASDLPFLPVFNGGNAAYSIPAGNNIVRSGTTLTGVQTYTLPACTSANLGEHHVIKNLPSQTFAITLAAAGSDLIDGSATQTIAPGNSITADCDAFASAGTWDLN